MNLSLALRFALRELTGEIRHFGIYVLSIFLGVAAIAAAGSLTEVFSNGLDNQSRYLLGGDLRFTVSQRRLDEQERAFAAGYGDIAETAGLNVMGQTADVRSQVDLVGVDAAYPLLGDVGLDGGAQSLSDALQVREGRWGVVVSQSFLDTFDLDVGDSVQLAGLDVTVTARMVSRPDMVQAPGGFGPEALIALDALLEAGRLQPGDIFTSRVRVRSREPLDVETVQRAFDTLGVEEGVELDGRDDAVDGLQGLTELLNTFLTLIGIAALIAGGVGAAEAARSFLQSRTGTIAALKALGADGGLIRLVYGLQLLLLALLGGGAGLGLGAGIPFILDAIMGEALRLPQALAIYPRPLLEALAYGVLIAAAFALPPLGEARATPPAALFRSQVDRSGLKRAWLERGAAVLALIAIVALALVTRDDPSLILILLGATGLVFVLFVVLAFVLKALISALTGLGRGLGRLVLANMSGPGSLIPTLLPALGLGLALLSLVVTVQSNLLRQISETAPSQAPALIFTQIPGSGVEQFDGILSEAGVEIGDEASFRRGAFLLVRLTRRNGEEIDIETVAEAERWVVRNEVNSTIMAAAQSDIQLSAGEWWPADYRGPLQVSVEAEAAAGLGVGVGDHLGFQVFGRQVEAEIASLRSVEWGQFGLASNTAFVFSPGMLEAANPAHVALAQAGAESEAAIIQAVGDTFPDVIVFQTRPALEAAAKIIGDLSLAVNAAAGLVMIAGLLVLFSLFASMARRRAVEAALLKTFGAERGMVLRVYALEFMAAAIIAAGVGLGLGVSGAWWIVIHVFEAQWAVPVMPLALIAGATLLVSGLGGFWVGQRTLSRPAWRVLQG